MNHQKRSLCACLSGLLLFVATGSVFAANVQIASLALGSFTLDSTSTYSMTSTSSGITGTAEITVDNNAAYGNWSSFIAPATSDWSSYEGYNLLMSVSGTNPNLPFTIYLSSGGGALVGAFTGNTANAGSTLTSVSLTWDEGDPNATITSLSQLTSVDGFGINWNGVGPSTGGSLTTITLAGIEAIPEPSTGSLILLGAAGVLALRRLRKV